MSQQNLKKQNKEDLGEMHPMEVDLILILRSEYRFGEVTIEMRDGLPQYLLRTVVRKKLGNLQSPKREIINLSTK